MDAPLIRFVTTADGVKIAYWRIGAGRVLVSLPALPHSHIQLEWEQFDWRRGYELTAAVASQVRYDARGTGLSQRDVGDFSLENHLLDLAAVIDDVSVDDVILFAPTNACPIAITYATRYPDRVSHLVMWIPVVDGAVHRKNPMLEAARQIIRTDWVTFSETVAHGLLGWDQPDAARRYAELIRAGIDQDAILPMVEAFHEFNVWHLLPEIRCPTLVLHRPALSMLPPGMAEQVAAAIPDARLALFEGSSSAPYIGDWRSIMRTIDEFLGGQLNELAHAPRGRGLRLLRMKDETLTPRELEIVAFVVQGLTNREIAEQLVLAPKTVENHIGRILVKLDLKSRTQLAAYAVERGLTGRTA